MTPAQAKKRVLVIDDEYAIRLLLKSFLETHDYEVRLAEDGESALRLFEDFRPELVITDIMMESADNWCETSQINTTSGSVLFNRRVSEPKPLPPFENRNPAEPFTPANTKPRCFCIMADPSICPKRPIPTSCVTAVTFHPPIISAAGRNQSSGAPGDCNPRNSEPMVIRHPPQPKQAEKRQRQS